MDSTIADQPASMILKQAVLHLDVSVKTMRQYVPMRGVPYYQPGGWLLFKASELDGRMQRSRKGDRGVLLGQAPNRRIV